MPSEYLLMFEVSEKCHSLPVEGESAQRALSAIEIALPGYRFRCAETVQIVVYLRRSMHETQSRETARSRRQPATWLNITGTLSATAHKFACQLVDTIRIAATASSIRMAMLIGAMQ